MAVTSNILELAAALILSVCTAYIVKQTILSPLKDVPGPVLAKVTNVYQSTTYYRGRQASVLRQLHDRYGPAVRVGPKHVSLSDPTLIQTIYTLKGDYTKSERYHAADTLSPDGRNIPIQFSTLDEKYQTRLWRPVAKYFALSKIVTFEPQIDNVIRTLQRHFEKRFCFGTDKGFICNLHTWLSFAAWEVINVVNFGQMLGFLEEGEDIDGALADSNYAADALMTMGHTPRLERILRFILGKPIFNGARQFSLKAIAARRSLGEGQVHSPPDFLDNFFEAHKADPQGFTEDLILAQLISNVAAGGDTSGATMSGIVYNTIKHPRVLKRLQEELDANVKETPISWKVASSLPYLDAVIQESIRFHPGTSFALERVVPKEGLHLPDGRFIKPGMVVGMHPWIVNRDKSVFGPNADFFVPERWLQNNHESAEVFVQRLATMKNTVLSFGAGKRRCIGKHLALLEIYKIVGTLFANFEIELVTEPKLRHSAFVRMEGFYVKLKVREKGVVG